LSGIDKDERVSPNGRDGDRSRETPEGVGKTTFGGFCCVEYCS